MIPDTALAAVMQAWVPRLPACRDANTWETCKTENYLLGVEVSSVVHVFKGHNPPLIKWNKAIREDHVNECVCTKRPICMCDIRDASEIKTNTLNEVLGSGPTFSETLRALSISSFLVNESLGLHCRAPALVTRPVQLNPSSPTCFLMFDPIWRQTNTDTSSASK